MPNTAIADYPAPIPEPVVTKTEFQLVPEILDRVVSTKFGFVLAFLLIVHSWVTDKLVKPDLAIICMTIVIGVYVAFVAISEMGSKK